MKRLETVFASLFLVLIASLIVWAAWSTPKIVATEKTVNWVGHPMISNNDPYTPSQGWLPGFQIGFRSDGVVVWREVPKGK